MAVIATMSSGKSTLINALLGKELLPNRNTACTALNYSVLDDDYKAKEKIFVTDKKGRTRVIEENLAEELSKINDSNDVTDVLIRSHVKEVLNTDKALLMIDTPGANNSLDASHKDILFKTLYKIYGGLFLYVINASQMGIYDDKELLYEIRALMDKNPKIKILFALNKMDVIDMERESMKEFVENTKDYVETCGFIEPDIVPVSAKAALLFKKVMSEEKLSRKEYTDFEYLYELYKPKDCNMKKFAITKELNQQFAEIELYGEKYRIGELNQAIENTGICVLENYIQKAQIMSSGQIKNTIKVRRK
jgi:GTPase SAR1 family protein